MNSRSEPPLTTSDPMIHTSDQLPPPVSTNSSPLRHRILASSVGSLLTAVAVTPLEVVKVRRQASVLPTTTALPSNVTPCPRGCGTFVLNNGLLDCVLPKSSVHFFDPASGKLTPQASRLSGGTFSMLRRILMQEGLPGIYAGLRPTLVMAVPNTVVYFTMYEEVVQRLRKVWKSENNTTSSQMAPLFAGGTARFLASSLTAPFELMRTRQAVAQGMNTATASSSSLWSEFRALVAQDGVRALYRGLAPTLWRDVPFSALYWLTIEQLRGTLWSNNSQETSWQQVAGQEFVNGAMAGSLASTLTTPFDVVKTRQQTAVGTTSASSAHVPPTTPTAAGVRCHHNGASVYKVPTRTLSSTTPSSVTSLSTLGALRDIAKREGLQGLWRGNQTRLFKVAPSCAIMISSYEMGKQLLQDY